MDAQCIEVMHRIIGKLKVFPSSIHKIVSET